VASPPPPRECSAHWHRVQYWCWSGWGARPKHPPGQLVWLGILRPRTVPSALTISRLTRWSIRYYNDTATTAKQAGLDRQAANGGLSEYYSEADTRTPTWLITGDKAVVAGLCGLDDSALAGGAVDTKVAAAWLDDGITPNGQRGRAFTAKSVHGFDLTFAAPKSVSLVRALTDEMAEKVLAAAHDKAIQAAMAYLHQHAGYTRVHNPVTGMKDLQRLPGLVGMAYQHETSRCGDPHLHTHVIVPNRQPRADGVPVSVDSKSLYHEAKAAGMIYQATCATNCTSSAASNGPRWTRIRGWPKSPTSPKRPSRCGRGAPPDSANGRGTISSWSTGNPPPHSWRQRRRPPAPPNPKPSRGRN